MQILAWTARIKIRWVDQLHVLGNNFVQRWHLLSRRPHQEWLSNASNGETKQDLTVQHHQFKFYKSLVTSIHLYGRETWILLAEPGKKDPGFRNQVHEETFPYLLLGALDQRLGTEEDHLPCGYTGTSSGNCQWKESCMVRATRLAPSTPTPADYTGHSYPFRFQTVQVAQQLSFVTAFQHTQTFDL